jgi:hypothetical protein
MGSGRRGGGCLTTIVVILVILAAVVYFGLNLLNDKAEIQLHDTLQVVIAQQGFQKNVAYSTITVDAAKGEVGLTNLAFALPQEGGSFSAQKVLLKVSPKEVASLLLNNGSGTLSKVDIVLEGVSYESPDAFGVSLGDVSFVVNGGISAAGLDDSYLSNGVLRGKDVRVWDKSSGFAFAAEGIYGTFKGGLFLEDISGDPLSILAELDKVEIEASNGKVDLPEDLKKGLEAMFGSGSTLMDMSSWSVEHVGMQLKSDGRQLGVEGFTLSSPLFGAQGRMDLPLNPDDPGSKLSVALEVENLNAEIRTQLAPFVRMLGQSLPAEGSFTFSLEQTGQQLPVILFRK